MEEIEPQMLKGLLGMLLLTLLHRSEDYGYSVVQRLRALGLTGAAEGTVYPALARLESRGLLRPRMVREGRGPARRYYRTSEAGVVELERLRRSWHTLQRVVEAVDDAVVAADPVNGTDSGATGAGDTAKGTV